MPELVLAKTAGNYLAPMDSQSEAFIAGCPAGAGFSVTVRRHNNPQFHRKLMALFQHAFDVWEPGELEYGGQPVRKEFEQFRKDMTILAGYYDCVMDVRGRMKFVAKSLNFSTMDHYEREALYSAVIDVILTRVLTNYTRDDLENVIAQTLGFAR
jgi:hypothetical protein